MESLSVASARTTKKELAIKGEEFAIVKEEFLIKFENPFGF